MASVNFRVNDALKEQAFLILKQQGVAPTEFFTDVLQYIVNTGMLPVRQVVVSEEDAALLALARQRMNDTDEMFEEISLDDL
ncbi:MAG: type II toxin-antitoxin system antitoxin, RelB/DinJ family [Acinetobacter sp.]|nr:MAG: type II toxin-antitoxin system antitoxin, RelB/DinJ family [Acinetobacter sp.]